MKTGLEFRQHRFALAAAVNTTAVLLMRKFSFKHF